MIPKRIARVFLNKIKWEIDRLQLALTKEYYRNEDGSKDGEKIILVLKLLDNLDIDLRDKVRHKDDEYTGDGLYEKVLEILNDYGDKYECMTMNKIVLLNVRPDIRRDLHKLFVMDINCVTEDDLRFYN